MAKLLFVAEVFCADLPNDVAAFMIRKGARVTIVRDDQIEWDEMKGLYAELLRISDPSFPSPESYVTVLMHREIVPIPSVPVLT